MKLNEMTSNYMDVLVDRIEGLTRLQRVLIYVGTFILLATVFIWFLLYPKFERVKKLEQEYQKVSRELTVAINKAKQLETLRKLEEEAKAKFQIARRALPEQKEIPLLLTSISEVGKEAGLEFLLFQPQAAKKKDFYEEIPVSVQVVGTYHQTALFFDYVANLPRVVNIRNIDMSRSKGGKDKLFIKCTPVTYRFIEAGEQPKDKSKKKGRKK